MRKSLVVLVLLGLTVPASAQSPATGRTIWPPTTFKVASSFKQQDGSARFEKVFFDSSNFVVTADIATLRATASRLVLELSGNVHIPSRAAAPPDNDEASMTVKAARVDMQPNGRLRMTGVTFDFPNIAVTADNAKMSSDTNGIDLLGIVRMTPTRK